MLGGVQQERVADKRISGSIGRYMDLGKVKILRPHGVAVYSEISGSHIIMHICKS